MTCKRGVAALLAAGGMFAAAPAVAQNDAQKKLIAGTLENEVRFKEQSGTALDPETAGYYQLKVVPQGFARDALCPADRPERDRLASAANDLFTWALNKKKNWGATARIFFDRVNVDHDDPALKPDAELKFFTVQQQGSNPENCTVPMANVTPVYSALYPLSSGVAPAPVHVELVTWYNDQAEQARIDALPKIAGGLLSVVGLPPTLLDVGAQALGTTPAAEFKKAINTERTSRVRSALYARQASHVGATAYLGLREPVLASPLTVKAKAVLTIQPISSIFSPTSPTFVSFAAWAPDQFLEWPLAQSGAKPLKTELGKIGDYSQMLTAPSYDILSNRCESLDLHLQSQLKLSQVDAAVIVNAVARKVASANPALSDLRKIGCLTNASRVVALKKVSIELPDEIDPDGKPPPANSPRMARAMESFAKLRGIPLDSSGLIDWSGYRFPLTVYDSADKFGWDNGRREFTADTVVELHKLLQEKFTNIGCWAFFEDLPVVFASGMGDVGAGRDTPVRKSAALGKLAPDGVTVIQFRYGGGGDAARITSIAFVPRDEMAKTKMLANTACDKGKADRDWMQPFLRPAPAQATVAPGVAGGEGGSRP